MIKGVEKTGSIPVDDILRITNGGFDIFKAYLGNVSRLMNRPWGRKEKKLSWGIFPKDGVWFYKDQANEETGNAFHFVQRMFGLDFLQAKDKICWDFGIGGKEINASPVKITWEAPEIEKKYTNIGFTHQPFKKAHHEFWNIAETTEEHCRKYNCLAIKDLAINSRRVNLRVGEVAFVYYATEGVKIYFPERERSKRFKSNVNFHHLWNYENLKDCNNLIVQKSNKDMIVTSMIEECCIATQAEAIGIFDPPTVEKINQISKHPWIWYGSDWDGVKKCKEITDTNAWRYINTDKEFLPDNDVYSVVKMWNMKEPGTGLKKLQEFMKLKKLI